MCYALCWLILKSAWSGMLSGSLAFWAVVAELRSTAEARLMLSSPRLVHREIRLAARGHFVGRDPDLPGLRSRGHSRRDLCRGVDGEGSSRYCSKRYLARAGELGSSNRYHLGVARVMAWPLPTTQHPNRYARVPSLACCRQRTSENP
jgi:hypothetical protein